MTIIIMDELKITSYRNLIKITKSIIQTVTKIFETFIIRPLINSRIDILIF